MAKVSFVVFSMVLVFSIQFDEVASSIGTRRDYDRLFLNIERCRNTTGSFEQSMDKLVEKIKSSVGDDSERVDAPNSTLIDADTEKDATFPKSEVEVATDFASGLLKEMS
ncbi:hypothetical protein GOBAR_DD05029 [Gossypium barbadense]|nr:hypothetical protein GOBAR_DD05029 [Gossypium barbadense]